MTLDIYSHVAPGLQEADAKRFDDLVINGNADAGDHLVTIGKNNKTDNLQ